MANTAIQIKRSTTTSEPTSLLIGELAYSYLSNTLFIGTSDGASTLNIGGQFYTSTLDSATSANTGGTLVKRDANNGFYGELYGNAETATKLLNGRNFSINGSDVDSSAVSFDGTGAVVLQGNLKTTGVTAGTYGGQTNIPVFTVDNKGRLSSAANVSIATSLSFSGDSGSGTLNLLTDALYVVGRDGITTTGVDANNSILIDVDNTVLRTTGDQTITGNISISGGLYITGNTTTVNSATLNVSDPLIYLAANNYSSDLVDIGFVGNYYDGSSQRHAGFFRKHTSNTFYAFTNYEHEPDSVINTGDASYRRAFIDANLTGGFVSGLANAISVIDGGTGAGSFTSGGLLIGNGTGALQILANSTYTQSGTLTAANTITAITVDAYGRFTNATSEAIAIDAGQITSGTLGVARGGTGGTSFTSGAILIGNGSGTLSTLANSTFTATGSGATNSTITSLTVDAYGRTTAATYSSISGLTVGQGGTGASTFTTNGIIYGNSTGALQVTAAAGTADQGWSNQILTTTNAGVPVWTTTLDGGQF